MRRLRATAAVALVAVACGCSVTHVKLPQGGSFTTWRLFDRSEMGGLRVKSSQGWEMELLGYEADRGNVRDLAPVAEAVAEGVTRGVVPGP